MNLRRLDHYESATIASPLRQQGRRYGLPSGGPMDRESYQSLEGEVWECFGLAIAHWEVLKEGWFSHSGMPRLFARNKIEICCPFAVRSGDIIRIAPITPGQVAYISLSDNPSAIPSPSASTGIRLHPSVDGLDQSELLHRTFTISLASNRIGLRLSEVVTGTKDLIQSEPSAPGVIQCTPGGHLIVVGPDGPTIGGYSRIGAVIDEDLDKLARIGFNQPFRFTQAREG